MAPPMMVTEDTPPDMLAGSMDLTVVLPNGHSLKMSIERSTPMMDLLVQVTTTNKMSPAGYILKPLNDRGTLPYKPSTPIGALDAWTIHVVPKQLAQCPAIKKPLKLLNQPFEQTFRLQVHLPRNQLYVARVSPKTRLSDILLQVCSEKNLDPLKYSLRHPINLDQVLSLHCTLGDYKLQEVTLVCNKSHPVEVSSVDIMSLQRETTNPAFRNTTCEGSVSSGSLEGRSLSPVPSDESSASPPPLPPSRPVRKRRPAPKPPTIVPKILNNEKQVNGIQSSTVINHSRNSSDSSGYHEASVLSESPQNNSIPEPRKAASVGVSETPLTVTLSQSMTDVSAIQPSLQQSTSCNSISSLSSATGRKKKSAPPPPPPVAKDGASSMTVRSPSVSSTASSTTTLDGNEANVAVKSATLPPSTRLNSAPPQTPSPPSTTVAVESSITPRVAPPVPRPRSKLLSDSDDGSYQTYLRDKPASPKKTPAPQPKPRKVVSPPSVPVASGSDNNKETVTTNYLPEEEKKPKEQKGFMNKVLPNSLFKSHKACIKELAFKFDVNSNKNETIQNVVGADSEAVAVSESEEISSITSERVSTSSPCVNESIDANKDDHNKEQEVKNNPIATSDPLPAATVMGTNTVPDAELRLADEEIDRIFSNATKNHTSPENEVEETQIMPLPSPVMSVEMQTSTNEEPLDWEYRLPAPPTFRDESKSPTVTEFGTITVGNLSDVVCLETVQQQCQNNTEPLSCEEPKNKDIVSYKQSKDLEDKINDTSSVDGDQMMRPLRREIRSSSVSSIYENEGLKSTRNSIYPMEQNIIDELSSTLNQRPSKISVMEIENKQFKGDMSSRSSTLENFIITTYKDTKPLEVFEDDSIKSSAGEKRDKSKDDAVFRAPKPRVKEPNLSRTSSFSIENNPNGPVIKRSVSYVSLLAANMPRHSQPYRAHLQRHRSSVGPDLELWPRLRKTSSEINIDKKDQAKDNSFWQDDSTELQSVQVLRNILSRSQANLSSSIEETDDLTPSLQRDSPTTYEDEYEKNTMAQDWVRSQSEEDSDKWRTPKPKFEHAASFGQEPSRTINPSRGPPSINLSTWSERPKRQVSIKNDGEYISGFGKKSTVHDLSASQENNADSNSSIKTVFSDNHPANNEISLAVRNESFKLEGRSKSISDLSRIPIVRAVELKKHFAGHSFDQTRLKPVEILEDVNIKKNIETADTTNHNGADSFIGVNSLARRFGVPQKRPVSEYLGNLNNKDFQSGFIHSSHNKVNNKSTTLVSVSSKFNNTFTGDNESISKVNVVSSKPDTTSEVKAQAKIRSGGFVENITNPSTLARTVSQPSIITSVKLSNPPQNRNTNIISGSKPTNISSISISSSVDQKTPSSSILIKQNHTLDRKVPVNLQPVVKGFRVPTDSNSSSNRGSSSLTKDVSVNSTNITEFPISRASYGRTLSTPSISITSTNIREKGKENCIVNVRSRSSSSSSITQNKTEMGSIPPPPPLMILKPVGERKGVKLLPPPAADPRDQLMESIRSFGKDNLKKVSTTVTKSSD